MMSFLLFCPKSDDSERGAGNAEYVLLVGLIAVAAIVVISSLGTAVSASIITAAGEFGEEASLATPDPVTSRKSDDTGQAGRDSSDEAESEASLATPDPVTSLKSDDTGQAGRYR